MDLREQDIGIVQMRWQNVMLVRGRVYHYLYPAMPIFSRRIYESQWRGPNIWGLDEPDQDSQCFRGVTPKYFGP